MYPVCKKIVDKNTIPYHPTKITSDDDLPTTEDDSLEQYLLADYLINQHNESHSNDESDKNIWTYLKKLCLF